jgi:hypothetical protein
MRAAIGPTFHFLKIENHARVEIVSSRGAPSCMNFVSLSSPKSQPLLRDSEKPNFFAFNPLIFLDSAKNKFAKIWRAGRSLFENTGFFPAAKA